MGKAKKIWTSNEAVEMMHKNTAVALVKIASCVKEWGFGSDEIIAYLIEISEELEAQALVVAMRDELNFSSPEIEG